MTTETAKSTHTPLPWRADIGDHRSAADIITSNGGQILCRAKWSDRGDAPWLPERETAEANVMFIVRAVNSHAQLLAALKAVLPCLNLSSPNNLLGPATVEQVRAAIAAAETPQ